MISIKFLENKSGNSNERIEQEAVWNIYSFHENNEKETKNIPNEKFLEIEVTNKKSTPSASKKDTVDPIEPTKECLLTD